MELNRVERVLEWVYPISASVILLAVAIVLIIVSGRLGDPYQPIVNTKVVNGLLQTETVGNLILPAAGTFKGPGYAVNPWTQVLIFRSKSKAQTRGLPSASRRRFQFDNQTDQCLPTVSKCNNETRQAALIAPGNSGKSTLQGFQQADQYNLPWPPEAGAQLSQYQKFPDKAPNSVVNGQINSLQPNVQSFFQQPNNETPFVKTRLIQGSALNASKDTSSEQTLTRFEIQFVQKGLVQVELAGGNGGAFWTGDERFANSVEQKGGRNGIVWAYVRVNAGDFWQVQVSQDGGSIPNTGNLKENLVNIQKNKTSTDSLDSGGGTGSFLSGSEGGGCTYVSTQTFGAQNGPVNGVRASGVFMAAGGGGGASRNAFGGAAGSSYFTWNDPNKQPQFGQPNPNQQLGGFPGGPLNVFKYSDILPENQYKQSIQKNQLSGGGASNADMGASQTVNNLPGVPNEDRGLVVKESSGAFLKGGTGSNNPPGGGGGGAGFRGGGSGTWNYKRAPNNQHGAGGGGSSFVNGRLRFKSTTNQPCANPFQGSEGLQRFAESGGQSNNDGFVFEASNYFLLALPPSI